MKPWPLQSTHRHPVHDCRQARRSMSSLLPLLAPTMMASPPSDLISAATASAAPEELA